MFDAFRTIAFVQVWEKLETLFYETNLDELELIWKDKEGDVIRVRSELEFRVAMKQIRNEEVIKFVLAPKGRDAFDMLTKFVKLNVLDYLV
jgi:hypothetical protein